MEPTKTKLPGIVLLPILFCLSFPTYAQVNVTGSIAYEQISNFDTVYSISSMKISGDGLKIVFATGGPSVKVFTINSDGSALTQIYDFQGSGTGPSVDISVSGEKVIWCDGEGEVFIANFDGSDMKELATLLPNPDTNFEDMEPIIPLPPRITADGGQVLFIHAGRDPLGSGVWKVNADDSGLIQVFNYTEMAETLFGTDTAVYNKNTAFSDGFDISADGSRMILGTKIFKLAAGDMDRGDAIAVDGTDFYNIGDYAVGYQPFATYVDGDMFTVFRREFNPELEYDEINVYFVPLGTGSPVKVISGIDIFGTSSFTQMASAGSLAIVHGANGRLPITRVDLTSQSQLDLVSIDGLSMAMGGYRFSESRFPSITWNGNRFCFLSTSNPPQIWVANINSDASNSQPSITEIRFNPDEVPIDGSTASTITAHVSDLYDTIHAVSFDAYQDGVFKFRALQADWPFSGFLRDDGTFGDAYAGDGFYTNNTVRADLPETPLGTYTVRIAAANASLKKVTSADAEPFYIVEPAPSASGKYASSSTLQVYPNPARDRITVKAQKEGIHDYVLSAINGQRVLEGKLTGSSHSIDISKLKKGAYFITIRSKDFVATKKIIKL